MITGAVALALAVCGGAAANAATFNFSTDVVVDRSTGSDTLTVTPYDTTSSTIADLNVLVNFSTCSGSFTGTVCTENGTASYPNELTLALTSPTGTTVSLVSARTYTNSSAVGGSYSILFDDSAYYTIGGSSPVSGNYAPVGSLADFIGETVYGDWVLTIGDTVGADPKQLTGWLLSFSTVDAVAPVPLPAALPLLAGGLGLMGLVARRRKRRA